MTLKSVSQGTPITLLELNTFGHAVLALFIYILWWEKPFDVERPSIVNSRLLSKRRALELMFKPSSTPVLQAVEEMKKRLKGTAQFQADGNESQPSSRILLVFSLSKP